MENREATCCFSGHRPMKLPWGMRETDERCIAAKSWIGQQLEELYELGYRHFISGMAIGCDTYFAEEVLRLPRCHSGSCYPLRRSGKPMEQQAEEEVYGADRGLRQREDLSGALYAGMHAAPEHLYGGQSFRAVSLFRRPAGRNHEYPCLCQTGGPRDPDAGRSFHLLYTVNRGKYSS